MNSPTLPPLSRSEATSPKAMRTRGHFGIIRVKRRPPRDSPPRLPRAISEESFGNGQTQSLPKLKEGKKLRRDSRRRVVLRHLQLDESLLTNSSASGSSEEEGAATMRSNPPSTSLFPHFSSSANTSFSDLSNRLKLSRPVEIFWEKKHSLGNAPSTRKGATMTLVNRKLYLFGGECRTLLNDIRVLSPETLKWEAPILSKDGDPPPEPRSGHSTVSYRNSLIVFGGGGAYNPVLKLRKCYNRLHLYDTSMSHTVSHKWTTPSPCGPVPQVRRNHAAAIIGSTMMIYGGLDEVGNVLEDLVAVNTETMRWFVPRIHKSCLIRPGKRHSLALVPVFSYAVLKASYFDVFHIPYTHDDIFTRQNSGFYLFGGLTKSGHASNDLFILRPKPVETKDDDYYLKWVQPEISGQPPEGRYAYSAALRGKYLAFYGGRNDELSGGSLVVRDIALLNLESMRWEQVLCQGLTPTGRWGCCISAYQTKIIIFGGMRQERYCSGKLLIAETDPRIVQEQKVELEYIHSVREQVGKNAFERVAKATMVLQRVRHGAGDTSTLQSDEPRESFRS